MPRMSGPIFPLALLVALVTSSVQAETIAAAQYASPVDRYGHFALGQPHEYARLIVTSDSGHKLALQLPDNEVFEDLAPRRASSGWRPMGRSRYSPSSVGATKAHGSS